MGYMKKSEDFKLLHTNTTNGNETIEKYMFLFLDKQAEFRKGRIEFWQNHDEKEIRIALYGKEMIHFSHLTWMLIEEFVDTYCSQFPGFQLVGKSLHQMMYDYSKLQYVETDFSKAYHELCEDLSLLTKDKEWFQTLHQKTANAVK